MQPAKQQPAQTAASAPLGPIGRTAVLLALSAGTAADEALHRQCNAAGYRVARGQVGSMELQKVIAAVETAAKRQGIVGGAYREEHALYHALLDALQGVCRGQLELGNVLRTVGLSFAVVRGRKHSADADGGEWIAISLYGQIGAPVKGWEHEVLGLGINHI